MTGRELKELREVKGLTQMELAIAVGKDKSTIQRWEAENRDLPLLITLAIERIFDGNSATKTKKSEKNNL